MFEFTLYILVSHVPAHIEASLTGAGITLLADISAAVLLMLILIQAFGSADGQISVLEGYLDFVLLKSRQIHFQLIFCICFTDVGFHQVFASASI